MYSLPLMPNPSLKLTRYGMRCKILKFATPQEVFSQIKIDAIAGVALQA